MPLKKQKHAAGFTLIEVIVVVGIIIVLMALLFPVFSKVRATARRSATQSQMSGIQTACESYYQNFRAYPSPISSRDYAAPATGGAFSESQGLVVSLTRAIFPNAVTPPAGTLTLGATIPNSGAASPMTVAADVTAPRDYSESAARDFGITRHS